MQLITTVIPAKDEEKNIDRCLKSVKWCDKIIVMWMGSDKTGEIAKKMGVGVIEMNKGKKDDFIAVQKNINWVIDNCKTDWILRIDADEVVTPELEKEIKLIVENSKSKIENSPVAYGIPRQQFFLGDFLRGGDWAYDRLVRLFKPKFARYEPLVAVHEQFKVNGKIGYLKNSLLHYSHPTLKDLLKKFDIYTTAEVSNLKETYISAFLKMIFLPPYIFARWMIWHNGWKDGIRGIVAGAFRGYYDLLLYSKFLKQNTIINKNNV